MKRREFIRNSIGLACLPLVPSAVSFFNYSEKENLKFIKEIKEFGEKQLGLHLHRKFYKKWLKEESQLTYLYVSRKDSIILPEGESKFRYFGTDTSSALEKSLELSQEGYDTMIYRTSGTSATRLTHHLLEYPREAILFIVLHEMAHVHRANEKLKIPYPAEESFGEFLGNHAAEAFAKDKYPELIPAIQKQRRKQESIYKLLIEAEKQTQGINLIERDKRYEEIQKSMNSILKDANSFQNERYNYPINHAYILRNRYYYKWYNPFKTIYENGKALKEMTEIYSTLPENQASTDLKLKQLSNVIRTSM